MQEFGLINPAFPKYTREVIEMAKAKVEKAIKIEDGEHTGIISRIEYREEPYNYVDIIIKEDKDGIELKCGVPFKVTENTALGLMLERFGATLEIDSELEIEEFLRDDMKVKFLTVTEKTDRGRFARVISNSLKPADK